MDSASQGSLLKHIHGIAQEPAASSNPANPKAPRTGMRFWITILDGPKKVTG
jgi:hypothetical protein